MKANHATQEMSNLGKDNVSKKPLDAAKKKLSLWSLFFFNTKFSLIRSRKLTFVSVIKSLHDFIQGIPLASIFMQGKFHFVWLTIIIKIDLEADIQESMLKHNQGRMLIESATSKITSCFFRDIFLSDACHVPARIVLQLSLHLFAPFFGFKCY